MSKYFGGLKFGMLLQLAIGPMCLMVFNTAQNSGFLPSMSLVAAIALVDAFYITLAALGVSRIIQKKAIKNIFKVTGSVVLIIFGINMICNVFEINFIPALSITSDSSSAFVRGIILTLSNPITIMFWGSVLTTKIIEEKFIRKDLIFFSLGLVSATVLFLSFIAVLGTVLCEFIPDIITKILNIIIGMIIVVFGIKILVKKEKNIL